MKGFIVTLLLVLSMQPGLSGASEEKPLNFDTQLISIFENAISTNDVYNWETKSSSKTDSGDAIPRLKIILGELTSHKMFLKNVVYRKDMNVMRVTWADENNSYIVKVAYKTGRDTVLDNSVYADKKQVVDIKIMYKVADGKSYEYMHLEKPTTGTFKLMGQPGSTVPVPVPDSVAISQSKNYRTEIKLTNEQCVFCHILAIHDGSPSGVFFPRYQESSSGSTQALGDVGDLFKSVMYLSKEPSDASALGLPTMSEEFSYSHVNVDSKNKETEVFSRTLFEAPQLVEVMARDNGKSYCVTIDFGEMGKYGGFGRGDYICADNASKVLHVKLTNRKLSGNGPVVQYDEPYYVK